MIRIVAIAAVAGLGLGSLYGLVAMGYTLILAASGVFSFAQGSIVMGAALGMLGLWQVLGWPLLGVIAVLLLGGVVVGIVTYLVAVLPVSNRPGIASLTEGTLVTTFGLGLVMNSVIALAFGYDTITVNSYVTNSPIVIDQVPIDPIYLVMIGAVVFIVIVMETFLAKTRTGLVLRATVEDAEGARLGGISIRKVTISAFALAGALAAIAGLMLVPVTSASPFIADQLGLYGFAAMAIGGYGSFKGAFVGGLVVGVATTVPPVWISPNLSSSVVYGLMLLVLLVRPRGLFGTAGAFGSARLRDI